MADVLKHRFISGKPDGPDATQVQPSHWNDGHAFTGGILGDSLIRDPTDPTYGVKWGPPNLNNTGGAAGGVLVRNPALPHFGAYWSTPVWITAPFVASDYFTLSGGTWSVSAGNVLVANYCVIGAMLYFNLAIAAPVSGNPVGLCRKIFGGYTVPRIANGPIATDADPGGGSAVWITTTGAAAQINMFQNTAGVAWPATTPTLRFQGFIEITV